MRLTHTLAVSAIVLLVACDNDPPPPPPPPTDGGPMDGSAMMDAGPDAMVPDGARPDGFVPDGDIPFEDGGVPVCRISMDDIHKLALPSDGNDRIVGLAAGGDSFGVIWDERQTSQRDIFAIRLSPTDGLGTEQQITDNFSNEGPPTLVASGSRWIASWVDNQGSVGFEARTQLLNADLSVSGAVNAITATDSSTEDNPTLVNVATGPMLFWVEDDMTDRRAHGLRLNTDATARGVTNSSSASGTTPGQLAAGELTDGPVLLWTQGIGATQDLIMQPLTNDGALRGSSQNVSMESNVDGTVDAALNVLGGAVVFGVNVGGVRSEVRFRAIDSTGALAGSEMALVSPPAIARDPSIAAFAGGYAISMRLDPMDGTGGPRIVLLLVDAIGNQLAMMDVAGAAAGGGRTTIRATATGQLAIAWADRDLSGIGVTVALIRCGG